MDGSGFARTLTAFALLGLLLSAGVAAVAAAGRAARLLRPARALAGVAALALALAGVAVLLGAPGGTLTWFTGFPGDPLRAGLDALSAPFALIVGLSAAATLSAWDLDAGPTEASRIALHMAFAAALALVICARHALLLLAAWELMTLASAALVAGDLASARARRATFVYLAMSQLGAAALAGALLSLAARAQTLQLEPLLAGLATDPTAALLIALVTLGTAVKLGLVPLHAWLPLAHPEAPAPASALMSGAMVKAGLYLLLRLVWQPLGTPPAAWGEALIVAGVASALTGALSAALDTDAKRVLAWSTVKHAGVLALGLGLAATLAARAEPVLAGVALAATLYHAVGHALAKTLGFLAVGGATHALGTRNLEQMGGLWRALPRTTLAAFVAIAALAGSPLLPLFAGEWLLYQVVILGHDAASGTSALHLLAPLAGAGLALAGALALAAMVKLLGIGFLGRPRDPVRVPHARERASATALFALAGLALAWGVLAPLALQLLAAPVRALLPAFDTASVIGVGSLALLPGRTGIASVSPLALAMLLALFGGLAWTWTRAGRPAIRRAPAWSCGVSLAPHQQYSARALTEPIRRVFASVIVTEDPAHTARTRLPRPGQKLLLESFAQGVLWVSGRVRMLQSGRLELYLGMLLATLVALLVWGR